MTLEEALGLAGARLIAFSGGGGKTGLMFALARAFAAAGNRVLVTTTTKIAAAEARCGWPLALDPFAPPPGNPVIAVSGFDEAAGKAPGFPPEVLDRLKSRFDRVLVEADGSARRPLKAPAAHEPVFPASTDAVVMVAGLSGVGAPLGPVTVFRPELWAERTGLAPGQPVTPESVARMAGHPEGFARGAPAAARRVLFLNQADSPERLDWARVIMAAVAVRAVAGRLLPQPEILAIKNQDRGTS